MANDLTGDFDVVVEFSLLAADRVLAAMHRGGRAPHSWTLRVDDDTHVHIPWQARETGRVASLGFRSVVDTQGDAVTDPVAAAKVSFNAPSSASLNLNFDTVVNAPKPIPSGAVTTLPSGEDRVNLPGTTLQRASHLVGVAQVQMGAPTMSLGRTSTSIVVHTPVMTRYTADENSLSIPNLLHGEFQVTIEVQHVSSSVGNFINVKLSGGDGKANFVPKWVSPAWDSEPTQLAAINKAVANALKTSFEPSSTPIPATLPIMRFKTMQGSQQCLAVMMDLADGAAFLALLLAKALGIGNDPDPGSVTN